MLILLDIPLARVGGVVSLAISGQNLSVPASVGFIALLTVVVGGLVTSTALTLLVVPALFEWFVAEPEASAPGHRATGGPRARGAWESTAG